MSAALMILGLDPFEPHPRDLDYIRPGARISFPPGETGEILREILSRSAVDFTEASDAALLPDVYCAPGSPIPTDPTASELARRARRENVATKILQSGPLSLGVDRLIPHLPDDVSPQHRVFGTGDLPDAMVEPYGYWVEGLWALRDPTEALGVLSENAVTKAHWVDLENRRIWLADVSRLAEEYPVGSLRLLHIRGATGGSCCEDAIRRGMLAVTGLMEVVYRLRAPGGCPWDRSHTHESLKPFLLEECHELIHAIDSGDSDSIRDELGDVLLQVALHAVIADEARIFDLADVARGIRDKMVLRHPHVFADASAETPGDVEANWERIKMENRSPETGLLEGVPGSLPALLQAEKVQSVASRVGFDWDHIDGPVDKLREEIEEFIEEMDSGGDVGGELGDVLFSLVNVARFLGLSAETELLGTVGKFRRRLGAVENRARSAGQTLSQMTLAEMDDLWNREKDRE